MQIRIRDKGSTSTQTARAWSCSGSKSSAPAAENTPAAPRTSGAFPPEEKWKRGERCQPVAQRQSWFAAAANRREPDLPRNHDRQPQAGGNPRAGDLDYRWGRRAGQAHRPLRLGLLPERSHQDFEERAKLRRVERGGAGYDSPEPEWSAQET